MFTKFFTLFWSISAVETWAVNKMDALLSLALKNLIHPQKVIAALSAIGQLFNFMVFRTPIEAFGDELNLDGYSLVFCDEFDGDSLDTDVWYYRGDGPAAAANAFYGRDTVSVYDGNLHIGAAYLEDGSYGPGWYAAQVALIKQYTRGYFECRCICGEGRGFWSAFWMQNGNSANLSSEGGVYGVELDICEANAENSDMAKGADAVLQCLHVNGGTGDTDDDVDTSGAIYFYGNNIYEEYNTYGVKWDENEYIFYVNGVETFRTSWRDGVSTVPEEVILSVCIPNANLDRVHTRDFTTDFTVDYVKIYQQVG